MSVSIKPATYAKRLAALQAQLEERRIDVAVVCDPDAVCYFAGFWNYLGMDFGRPTILIVPRGSEPTLITPLMESEMARRMSAVEDIRPWSDGVDAEWRGDLRALLGRQTVRRVAFERTLAPAAIALEISSLIGGREFIDLGPLIAGLRRVKTTEEIALMRKAGEVAVAMVKAGRQAIGEGVPEYELALATLSAGTRKAAEFIDPDADRFLSPTIYNLQIMQSGRDTCMVHRRSSTKRLERGDPVYFCFCGVANFANLKLGFDREFFVGSVTDEAARVYETTAAAQQAALKVLKPGIRCEEVNAAAEAVYRDAGFSPGYRTGRSIGYSFLESPELKRGEQAIVEAGMTFAVDGGITIEGKFGGRIGDSVVVTEDGFDYLTPYPRNLTVL
jgi:Xaa-Pro dipeptidase